MTAPIEHPPWCVTTSCTANEGGEHASRAKLVPVDSGTPLLIDLVEELDGRPQVRLSCGESEVRMPLRSGRTLAKALGDLVTIGRRAER